MLHLSNMWGTMAPTNEAEDLDQAVSDFNSVWSCHSTTQHSAATAHSTQPQHNTQCNFCHSTAVQCTNELKMFISLIKYQYSVQMY